MSDEYKSAYDKYRFVTPEESSAEQTVADREKVPAKEKKKMGAAAKILIALGVAAFLGLAGLLVFTGMTLFQRIETGVRSALIPDESVKEAIPRDEAPKGEQAPDGFAGKTEEKAGEEAAEKKENGETDTKDKKGQESTSTASASGMIRVSLPSEEEMSVVEVVRQCMPSMVAISCITVQQYYDYFGQNYSYEVPAAGSGIIVGQTDTELLIATNHHVIEDGSDITVSFVDNSAVSARIKGSDIKNDLAILSVKLEEIEKETLDEISIIAVGDSEAVEVGESVVAIGNALGYGQSVSAGIISAKGRQVSVDNEKKLLLQTDASINPGNSGGALLNMHGELIGINEIKYVSNEVEGVGYAIPMETAEPILAELGSKQAREKVKEEDAAYMGIVCSDVANYLVESGYPAGVRVERVSSGSPAEQAGLQANDFITSVDGDSVRSTQELLEQLSFYAAGETVPMTVERISEDGTEFEEFTLTITFGKKSEVKGTNQDDPQLPKEAPEDPQPEKIPQLPFPFNWNHQG